MIHGHPCNRRNTPPNLQRNTCSSPSDLMITIAVMTAQCHRWFGQVPPGTSDQVYHGPILGIGKIYNVGQLGRKSYLKDSITLRTAGSMGTRRYTTVCGLFLQDDSESKEGAAIPPRFGLKDDSGDRWIKFRGEIERLNVSAAPGAQYKVVFLGRHGQGYRMDKLDKTEWRWKTLVGARSRAHRAWHRASARRQPGVED